MVVYIDKYEISEDKFAEVVDICAYVVDNNKSL